MENIKIGVVGAGPIGGILAAHLVKSGVETVVCDADHVHLEAIRKNGLEVTGLREMVVKLPDTCSDIVKMKSRHLDVLFLAFKTSVLEPVMPLIREIFHKDMLIVSFQNGLGTEDYLAEHFGDKNVARAIVNYAGNTEAPGKVRMSFFTGSNYLGALNPDLYPRCRQIAELINLSGLETEFTLDVKKHEWEKVILNCSLSPLSALTGLTMKDVMEGEKTRALVKAVNLECIQVARVSGIDFSDDFHEFCIGYLDKAGRHKPSMLIDVETGVKSEIDFLNGKIAEYGKKHGVPTPINTTLATMVDGIDRCRVLKKVQK